ncbi:radical SAM protein [bacterium]|nr:radical SAM protein [bacterium]
MSIGSVLRILWRLHTLQPVAISFNVTHRCNLKCLMCNIHKIPIDELSLDQLEPVLVDLKQSGFEVIEITGGEPFLRQDIFELFTLLEQIGFHYTINSNGILIDREIARRLSELPGILQIALSIDSLKPELYAQIRGVDRLAEVINGLDLLLTTRLRKPLKVNLTVNRFNFGEVLDILDFCTKRGVYLSVFPVNLGSDFRHRSIDASLVPTQEECENMAGLFQRLEKLKKQGAFLWEHSSFYRGAIDYILNNRVPPCDAGRLYFDLHADGKIAVCNDLPPFGDLTRERFQDCLARLDSQQEMIRQCYRHHPCYYTCTYAISTIARHKISYALESARMMGLSRLIATYLGQTPKPEITEQTRRQEEL